METETKKEPTAAEVLQRKIDNALKRLKESKKIAEKNKKEQAVFLADRFRDKDDNSKTLKDKYYMDYIIEKTKIEAFTSAINQIEASLMYG